MRNFLFPLLDVFFGFIFSKTFLFLAITVVVGVAAVPYIAVILFLKEVKQAVRGERRDPWSLPEDPWSTCAIM